MIGTKSMARKDAGRREALDASRPVAHNDVAAPLARTVTAELSLRARCVPEPAADAERRRAGRA